MEEASPELYKTMQKILHDFKKGNAMELRLTANELIKKAVKNNSKIMAEQSIAAYVLHKILTKEHIIKSKAWPRNRAKIVENLEKMVLCLRRGQQKEFTKMLARLHSKLERIDSYFGRFVQSLLDKARVKYASDAYFMGTSLGQAAELLGADKKTLLAYIGATRLYDKEAIHKGIAERMRELKKALGD
ncbi:MAG: hypothetical protein Q6368_002165 [Candidatus Baldrarchaeota archaeon]